MCSGLLGPGDVWAIAIGVPSAGIGRRADRAVGGGRTMWCCDRARRCSHVGRGAPLAQQFRALAATGLASESFVPLLSWRTSQPRRMGTPIVFKHGFTRIHTNFGFCGIGILPMIYRESGARFKIRVHPRKSVSYSPRFCSSCPSWFPAFDGGRRPLEEGRGSNHNAKHGRLVRYARNGMNIYPATTYVSLSLSLSLSLEPAAA